MQRLKVEPRLLVLLLVLVSLAVLIPQISQAGFCQAKITTKPQEAEVWAGPNKSSLKKVGETSPFSDGYAILNTAPWYVQVRKPGYQPSRIIKLHETGAKVRRIHVELKTLAQAQGKKEGNKGSTARSASSGSGKALSNVASPKATPKAVTETVARPKPAPALKLSEEVTIVGRVRVRLDGFQGQHRFLERPWTVHIKTKSGRILTTTVDGQGYYTLTGQERNTSVQLLKIVHGKTTAPMAISRWREAGTANLVNLGDVVLNVDAKGRINPTISDGNVTYYYQVDGKAFNSTTKDGAGYPILSHFAKVGPPDIKREAERMLEMAQRRKRAAELNTQARRIEDKDPAGALALYRKAAALMPCESRVHERMIDLYDKLGQPEGALKTALQGINACPEDAGLIHIAARRYEKLNNLAKALEYHRRYLAAKPNDSGAYRSLSRVLMKLDRPEEADRLWLSAAAKGRADLILAAAGHFKSRQAYPQAIELYQRYLTLKKTDHWGWAGLLNCYRRADRIDDAKKLVGPYLANAKSDSKYAEVGDFYKSIGEFAKAEENYKQYLDAKPTYRDAVERLASLYAFLGRPAEGEALWGAALANAKMSRSKYNSAAKFYYQIGKYDRALELFTKYRQLSKPGRWDDVLLARTYLQLGDESAAKKLLARDPSAYKYYYAHWGAADSKRYGAAIGLLRDALANYGDQSLSKVSKEEIKQKISRLEGNKSLDTFWLAYLRQIQKQGDGRNWTASPADRFEARYPAFANSATVKQQLTGAPSVTAFNRSMTGYQGTAAGRPAVTGGGFKKPNRQFAQQVVKRYKSIPGGITVEGVGEGLSSYNRAVYRPGRGEITLNGAYHYKLPVSPIEGKEILNALADDDRLGVSLGSYHLIYGAITPQSSVVIKLKLADRFLAGIVFNESDWLKDYKLANNYRPLNNTSRLGSGGVAVYFMFGRYRFVRQGDRIALAGSGLDITLIPLSDKKGPNGGHLPDEKALAEGRSSYAYQKNIEHLSANIGYYMKEPLVASIADIGQFAAFARALKKNGVDLKKLAASM